MKNFRIIAIAGGSGSGKSTLAVALCRKYPDQFALVHIDDYFKKREHAPVIDEFTNWDHPEAVRFDDLYQDLLSLRDGKSATVLTKSELYHPAYDSKQKNKLEYIIDPKPIVILEGYLAFYDPRIRALADMMIYLDIAIEESTKRRSSNKFSLDEEYFKKVLMPMHKEFVEPTKAHAHITIDAGTHSPEEILAIAEKEIFG